MNLSNIPNTWALTLLGIAKEHDSTTKVETYEAARAPIPSSEKETPEPVHLFEKETPAPVPPFEKGGLGGICPDSSSPEDEVKA